jgi:hypothetical protein
VRHIDQQRRELAPAPFVAADRERAERVAVIALAPRDEVAPLRLADLDEILARELERGLDRLGPAGQEVYVRDARRRVGDELVGQLLGDLGGEEAGMRVGDAVDLLVHRAPHLGVPVTEARHRRATRGIEILLAFAVDERDTVSADGDRQGPAQLAMQDASQVLACLQT